MNELSNEWVNYQMEEFQKESINKFSNEWGPCDCPLRWCVCVCVCVFVSEPEAHMHLVHVLSFLPCPPGGSSSGRSPISRTGVAPSTSVDSDCSDRSVPLSLLLLNRHDNTIITMIPDLTVITKFQAEMKRITSLMCQFDQ